ncbi:spore coat protein GerQ [Bacillus sp. 165]|nr:spore coat protein GerQ [Bacillus sp. 165]
MPQGYSIPPQQQVQAQFAVATGQLPIEQSYIENILRLNKGKKATVYMTFERGSSLGTKTFTGTIEAAGRDHIIISDATTGKRYLLLMVYLDYVEFDEAITYLPGQLGAYSSRPY